jgi:hypothetical protein
MPSLDLRLDRVNEDSNRLQYQLKYQLGEPERGSEWEPIKFFSKEMGTPKRRIRLPKHVSDSTTQVGQEPSSPTTSHAFSSQQEKVLSRMATHGSSSEHNGDDGDDEDSSSDEEVESMVDMYVKKIFKYVMKINMYG